MCLRFALPSAHPRPRTQLINPRGKQVHLEVKNESHGAIENESHFHVLIVAEAFEGMRMLEQHRRINAVLTGGDSELPFHSLRITSKAPTQWAGSQAVPAAPSCKGGDGIPGKDGQMQRTSRR